MVQKWADLLQIGFRFDVNIVQKFLKGRHWFNP